MCVCMWCVRVLVNIQYNIQENLRNLKSVNIMLTILELIFFCKFNYSLKWKTDIYYHLKFPLRDIFAYETYYQLLFRFHNDLLLVFA